MKITARPCPIAGAFIVESEAAEDERGSFFRSFCAETFTALGLPAHFPQENLSANPHSGTLRGLHYQQGEPGEYKLVRCVAGRIWDVMADLRQDSPTYGKWHGCELSLGGNKALFIPAGCAHGFITLEPNSTVHYRMGCTYRAEDQRGIRFDDPALAIAWPAAPELISPRDRELPYL